ncbi:GNAT family N-acetyltransferase [Flavivirga aquimarina]|uniref:GNAT family N-acetyltransferase n=1 Tax=Flavivirga aquimarina TaxID=2027862 RepID=A0ABT8WBN5_9FLAO|nr:GNAT family N-acetyltransferase [Flavivirga aquimarina]MDO5970477.1 GNAT family N-acetyltransferase [Flavivirga aquimarina]
MEVGNTKRFYRIHWLWNILRYGLFMQGLRNRFAKIGIDVMPYYWTLEGAEEFEPPKIKGDDSGFEMSYFGEIELDYIQNKIKGIAHKDLKRYLKEGQICVGLKCYNDIVAYMFIKKNEYRFRGKTFKFEKNEAYLHTMYTFEAFRGRGIAPYLRYQCYKIAKKEGITRTYSISEYFNKSSKKFKKKLCARNTELYISIVLFKKIRKTFLLKKYD